MDFRLHGNDELSPARYHLTRHSEHRETVKVFTANLNHSSGKIRRERIQFLGFSQSANGWILRDAQNDGTWMMVIVQQELLIFSS